MPGISIRSESEVLISSFKTSYKEDWDKWLITPKENWPEFSKLLKKWQAVRPNKIRGSKMLHEAPYIEDLLTDSYYLVKLVEFDMSQESSFSETSMSPVQKSRLGLLLSG